MFWFDSIISTFLLIIFTSIISISIGTLTAVSAWWSNKTWAYYVPLLILGVPPWLLSYYLSEFGYINPWLGASVSLGVCCSVYPHSIVSASLANRAHKAWEMMTVVNGQNFKSLFTAIWPSLKLSLLPSIAIIAAECVADFGVSNFYGLNTVTMLTYNIWTSTWNMSQIWWGVALLALLGIAISQLDLKTSTSLQGDNSSKSRILWAILAILPTIMLIGFGVYTSLAWIVTGATFEADDFLKELLNTLYLTIVVVIMCVSVSAVYFSNIGKQFLERSGLGFYAMPGTVIGATILYFFGPYVSLFVLLSIGITLRYYGLMINTVSVADKGNQRYFEVIDFYTPTKIKRILDKARIVLPSVALGVCLIVLDVIRELPISMILQPMNFQTLAMRMNYIARSEAIPNLGPHSLVILSLGIVLCSVIIKLIYDTDKKSKF
jgi:iron(III) transport system permease protein